MDDDYEIDIEDEDNDEIEKEEDDYSGIDTISGEIRLPFEFRTALNMAIATSEEIGRAGL